MPDMSTSLSDNGLPTNLGSNIQAPSLNDLGGSLGNRSTDINSGPTNAFGQYKNYVSGAGSPTNPLNTYQDLLKQNGIPQLQQTSENLQTNVNNLEGAINRVPTNVNLNTGNSLVTEGQRAGMVNAEQYPLGLELNPLSTALGNVNNSLSTQEQNIGNEVNAVGQNNQMLSTANSMGVTVAQDNAARTMSGYTSDADNMLKGLLQKMQINGTLDADEWQTLSDLATNKQKYEQALGEISAQNQADIRKTQVANQFQTLNPSQTLVNTLTGTSQRAR